MCNRSLNDQQNREALMHLLLYPYSFRHFSLRIFTHHGLDWESFSDNDEVVHSIRFKREKIGVNGNATSSSSNGATVSFHRQRTRVGTLPGMIPGFRLWKGLEVCSVSLSNLNICLVIGLLLSATLFIAIRRPGRRITQVFSEVSIGRQLTSKRTCQHRSKKNCIRAERAHEENVLSHSKYVRLMKRRMEVSRIDGM